MLIKKLTSYFWFDVGTKGQSSRTHMLEYVQRAHSGRGSMQGYKKR